MPKILDVICHRPSGAFKGQKHLFLIVDKLPEFLYERKGNCLVASDDGFYNTYFYDSPGPNWKAFAGRKFDIPMKDGSVEKAYGQWWDGKHQENAPEPIISVGVNTLEELGKCYVFCGAHISADKLARWKRKHKQSTDYYKYAQRTANKSLNRTGTSDVEKSDSPDLA